MPKFKTLAPAALLIVGAVSMVGMYALADTKAPTPSTPTTQTQTVAQTQVDDHNTTADVEVNDDNGVQASSTISQENNDGKSGADTDNIQDGQQNDQNEVHDIAQPGEVEDGN